MVTDEDKSEDITKAIVQFSKDNGCNALLNDWNVINAYREESKYNNIFHSRKFSYYCHKFSGNTVLNYDCYGVIKTKRLCVMSNITDVCGFVKMDKYDPKLIEILNHNNRYYHNGEVSYECIVPLSYKRKRTTNTFKLRAMYYYVTLYEQEESMLLIVNNFNAMNQREEILCHVKIRHNDLSYMDLWLQKILGEKEPVKVKWRTK